MASIICSFKEFDLKLLVIFRSLVKALKFTEKKKKFNLKKNFSKLFKDYLTLSSDDM